MRRITDVDCCVAERGERVPFNRAQAGEKTIAPVDKFATCAVWSTGTNCYIINPTQTEF